VRAGKKAQAQLRAALRNALPSYKGLKPIVLFECMYGLKPVPFREEMTYRRG